MSAHDRTIALGRHLRDWASRPPADFREFWRNHVLAHESEKCGYLEEQLDEDYDTPEFWREDVESYLRHVRDAMTYPDFDIPYDLKSGRSDEANRTLIQALIADFGQLLEAWPAIFNTARELRESGPGLMRWF